MQEVIIYSTPICPYCERAKALFDKVEVPYTIVDISSNVGLRDEMVKRSGGRHTVPQIFIGNSHIGGFDELKTLHQLGKLQDYLTD